MTDDLWHRDGPWAPLTRDRPAGARRGGRCWWPSCGRRCTSQSPRRSPALGPQASRPPPASRSRSVWCWRPPPVAVVVTLLGVRGVRRGAVPRRVIGWFALVLGGVALCRRSSCRRSVSSLERAGSRRCVTSPEGGLVSPPAVVGGRGTTGSGRATRRDRRRRTARPRHLVVDAVPPVFHRMNSAMPASVRRAASAPASGTATCSSDRGRRGVRGGPRASSPRRRPARAAGARAEGDGREALLGRGVPDDEAAAVPPERQAAVEVGDQEFGHQGGIGIERHPPSSHRACRGLVGGRHGVGGLIVMFECTERAPPGAVSGGGPMSAGNDTTERRSWWRRHRAWVIPAALVPVSYLVLVVAGSSLGALGNDSDHVAGRCSGSWCCSARWSHRSSSW